MDSGIDRQVLLTQLVQLRFLMNMARSQYQPSGPDHGRAAIRIALYALKTFVTDVFPDGAQFELPLNGLLYGLADLEKGISVPLFEARDLKGRPPTALNTSLFRATAAALMDLNQQAGAARKEAARQTALTLRRLGYKGGEYEPLTGQSVEDWRDEMKAAPRSGNLAAERFRFCLSLLAKMFPGDAKGAAQYLIACLPDLFVPPIPKKHSI